MKIIRSRFNKKLKEIVKKLDDSYNKYQCVDISWYDRYYDESYIYLLVNKTEIVGYVYASPITKNLYDKFNNCEITNDYEISPKHFLRESSYYYISSILIKKEYKNRGYGKKLLESLLQDLYNKNVIVMTISNEGYNLCNKYFEFVKKINDEKYIFKYINLNRLNITQEEKNISL